MVWKYFAFLAICIHLQNHILQWCKCAWGSISSWPHMCTLTQIRGKNKTQLCSTNPWYAEGTKKHNIHQNVYRKNKPKRRNDTVHLRGASILYTKKMNTCMIYFKIFMGPMQKCSSHKTQLLHDNFTTKTHCCHKTSWYQLMG